LKKYLSKFLFFLKTIYQTFIIKITLFYYKSCNSNNDQISLAKDRLNNRNFIWKEGAPIKVFAIFSINNWESQLLEPLNLIGEVHHFSWPNIDDFFVDKSEWEKAHLKINENIITEYNKLIKDNVNLIVFLYTSDFIVSKSTIAHFQNRNTFIISFCWDDILYFKGVVKGQPVGVSELSKGADINLTFSPEAIPRYNFFKSPCFFWQSIPQKNDSKSLFNFQITNNFYVLFIGSKYGNREVFVNKLIENGIPMKCYGKGWPNGGISEEQMEKEIQLAPLTLGFSNVGYTRNITTIKGRDFEVPLLGGLYLTQYSKGLEMYYDLSDEILTYTNLNDCISKIKFLQKYPYEAFKIRKAGWVKANKVSKWDSRIAFLQNLIDRIVYPINT